MSGAMELCARMQVKSSAPACYLASGASSSNNRVRASVSWLRQKQFARLGRSRVERIQRSNTRWCCTSSGNSSRSSELIRDSFLSVCNSGPTGGVPYEANFEGGSGAGGDDGSGGGEGGGDGGDGPFPEPGENPNPNVFALLLAFCGIASASEGTSEWYRISAAALGWLALFLLQQQTALALSGAKAEDARKGIWEVSGGRWKYLVPHPERDEYVVATVKNSEEEALAYEELVAKKKGEAVNGEEKEAVRQHHVQQGVQSVVTRFVELGKQLLLPDGYPQSVTDDYMEYTLWRMGQVIASQISGVLTTQVCKFSFSHSQFRLPVIALIRASNPVAQIIQILQFLLVCVVIQHDR